MPKTQGGWPGTGKWASPLSPYGLTETSGRRRPGTKKALDRTEETGGRAMGRQRARNRARPLSGVFAADTQVFRFYPDGTVLDVLVRPAPGHSDGETIARWLRRDNPLRGVHAVPDEQYGKHHARTPAGRGHHRPRHLVARPPRLEPGRTGLADGPSALHTAGRCIAVTRSDSRRWHTAVRLVGSRALERPAASSMATAARDLSAAARRSVLLQVREVTATAWPTGCSSGAGGRAPRGTRRC